MNMKGFELEEIVGVHGQPSGAGGAVERTVVSEDPELHRQEGCGPPTPEEVEGHLEVCEDSSKPRRWTLQRFQVCTRPSCY